MNIAKQDLLYSFWKFYEVRSERGGFQLIQIPGLLGIYFDAVVVEVKTFFTFIQIDSGHTLTYLIAKISNCRINKNIAVRFPKHVCLSEGLLSLRLRIIWFQLKKLNLDWITHTSSIFWLYIIMESKILWNWIIISNYLHIQQWFHELILERSLKIVSKKDQTEIHENFGPIERV